MKILKFFKKPSVIILIILLSSIGAAYYRYNKNKKPVYETVIVRRGTVSSEVNVTGRVRPANEVSLAFERGGRISRIAVSIGDEVSAGKPMIELDRSELQADLSRLEASRRSAAAGLQQYQAALDAQRAKLDELARGTRPEEITIAETKVKNAAQSLADAEKSLENTKDQAAVALANLYDSVPNILSDSYVKADDAVTKQIDGLFYDDNTNPRLSYITADSQAQIDSESKRAEMTLLLSSWRADLDALSREQLALDAALNQSYARLIAVMDFFTRLTDTLNTSTSLSQSLITSYKGYVNTARINVNTALANVSAQQQAIASKKSLNQDNISAAEAAVNLAKNNLTLAQNELLLKQAGATADQIKAQEAAVRQAEASLLSQQSAVAQAAAAVENLQAQIAKTVLLSPIDGLVTKLDAEVGEIVAANSTFVTVISGAKFQIEADVPEADIAKINIGGRAVVTLDAYGDNVNFEVKVISIDPAGKLIEGVATYRAVLQFMDDDERIKSGMTANLTIAGERRADVLFVPQRAVTVRSGAKTVRILEEDIVREAEVQTGVRGADGNVEIIDGIKEGELAVTNIIE